MEGYSDELKIFLTDLISKSGKTSPFRLNESGMESGWAELMRMLTGYMSCVEGRVLGDGRKPEGYRPWSMPQIQFYTLKPTLDDSIFYPES